MNRKLENQDIQTCVGLCKENFDNLGYSYDVENEMLAQFQDFIHSQVCISCFSNFLIIIYFFLCTHSLICRIFFLYLSRNLNYKSNSNNCGHTKGSLPLLFLDICQ